METTVRKIGNSLGVILPKQIIDEFHLKQGATLSIKKNGSKIEISSVDKEFDEWLESYNQANLDYKEVLQALAK